VKARWPELAIAGLVVAVVAMLIVPLPRPLLDGLSPEQRRAVQLVDLDGLDQAEAARREEVSLSGMKSRVQRGRRRLVEVLGQCCALTLDARGVPMDYEPPRGSGCNCG